MIRPRKPIISKSSACKSCLLRYSNRPHVLPDFSSSISVRSKTELAQKSRRGKNETGKTKKKVKQEFSMPDKKSLIQFSLCDAMRCVGFGGNYLKS